MENKCKEKNTFEFGFDSFELDDGFLTKIDLDLKKSNLNASKANDVQKEKEKKKFEIKAQYYDSPLSIKDLDDSDCFDFSKSKKKHIKLQVVNDHMKNGERQSLNNGFISCLSPILGHKPSRSMNLSSSTPERDPNESHFKLKQNSKTSDQLDLEADLFDDWDVDDKKKDTQRETVTLSQAMALIEEAESEKHFIEESLNNSIDLLTGEIVGTDVRVMFEESFNVPKSEEKNESSSGSVNIENVKIKNKPPAAQKLNFESGKNKKSVDKDFCFSSDEDFNFCTQDLLKKTKQSSKCAELNSDIIKSNSTSPVKGSDLNESSEGILTFHKKRKKSLIIIESDSTEDSPSPKFLKQSQMKKKRKNSQKILGRSFICSQAEISDPFEVSSDEAEQEGEYNKSFLDESSYFTQNFSADMTAKYLESVKEVNRPDAFKIPAPKPYSPLNVFSQIPEESNSDYEIDSFCVIDVDDEESKSELSDLEIAEKILEMDRKKRKKKRSQKLKKLTK